MGSKLCVAQATDDKRAPAMEGLKQREEGIGYDEGPREGHTCEGNGCCNETNINTITAQKRLAEAVPASSPVAHKSLAKEEEISMLLAKQKEMEENNRLHMEDISKFIHQKESELHRLKRHLQSLEENNSMLMEDNIFKERYIDRLHASHREEVLTLNETVKHYQDNCRVLSMRIERAEHLHSQQSMADSGSYQDSAATPPLLQHAADAVKDATTACASELFSRIKKNSDLAYMNIDPKETVQMVKVAWQNFLCHMLFKCFEDPFFSLSNRIICFEDPFFSLSNRIIPPFDRPVKRKNQFLQAFKRCRDMDARQMLNEDTDFAHFFKVKTFEIGDQLKERLLMIDDAQIKEDFISSELGGTDSSYYGKLLRLAKAVWVLHKLAFAFEPTAEIFRVGQNSILDEEFMEDVAGDDDDDSYEDDDRMAEKANIVKQVRFMCVPGFIVRHTIIKSRVFSLKESQPRVCSVKPDPCAMALD